MKERFVYSEETAIAHGLAGESTDAKLKSLRQIKNQTIGNKREKTKHLLYLPTILEILSTDSDAGVLVQAAQAIGSFASAPDGAKLVAEHDGVQKLLHAMQSSEERVVEAAVRALKLLFKNSSVSAEVVLSTPGALARLVSLLPQNPPALGESAANVLARCCPSKPAQDAVLAANALPALVALLPSAAQRARQAAALLALAALTADHPAACCALLRENEHDTLPLLLTLAKTSQQPRVRFTACLCLTQLCQHVTAAAPPAAAAEEGSSSSSFPFPIPSSFSSPSRSEVEHAVLPALLRLLSEPEVAQEVPSALAALFRGNPSLCASAAAADIISNLAGLVQDPQAENSGRSSALQALGMLCSEGEDHRKQLVDCGAVPAITAALTDPCPAVRSGACACIRSLSRSTRLLRCCLGSLEAVAAPLLELSRSDDVGLAAEAAGALANMAAEYSALKDQLLLMDGIGRFASLAASMHSMLRLHGVWGLSSVAYMASAEIKAAVMRTLPWATAAALLRDEDFQVRIKTLLLLRNLVHKGGADANSVLAWSGGQALDAVLEAMESRPPAASSSPSAAVAYPSSHLTQHALYTIVNISSGGPAHKEAVMAAGWAPQLMAALEHENGGVREAAVWAVINLTWGLDGDAVAVERRRSVLRELGAVAKLQALLEDPNDDVRERAVTALRQFHVTAVARGATMLPGGNEGGEEGGEQEQQQQQQQQLLRQGGGNVEQPQGNVMVLGGRHFEAFLEGLEDEMEESGEDEEEEDPDDEDMLRGW